MIQKRRRKLPGCICPKCGAISISVGIRYTDSRGNERDVPVRRFACKCGHKHTYPATDRKVDSAPPTTG